MSRRRLIAGLAGLLAALAVAACGKKGEPEPPPEEKIPFPRKYPS